MDLLEVPLEVALRLYSFPGASSAVAAFSAWAWAAAFLAAALGLWGIRAVGSRSDASTISLSPSPAAPSPPPPSPPVAPVAPPAPAPPTIRRSGEARATKARYTAYYLGVPPDDRGVGAEEDECDFDDEEEEEEDAADRCVVRRRVVTGEGCGDCRREAARRRWDLGWYLFQDMMALDGRVVRLWDGGDGGLTAKHRKSC